MQFQDPFNYYPLKHVALQRLPINRQTGLQEARELSLYLYLDNDLQITHCTQNKDPVSS